MKSITNVKFYEDHFDLHNSYYIRVTADIGDQPFLASIRIPVANTRRPTMARRHHARRSLCHELRLNAE